MVSESQSLRREITIVNELGLHARSAAKLARMAREAKGAVWIEAGDAKVDAKEILDIMTLGAALGDMVRIGIETADDLNVLESIVALVVGGFGE